MAKAEKKVDAFNLDKRVLKHIVEEAGKDNRKKSDWLNLFLMKAFKIEQKAKAPKATKQPTFNFKKALLANGVEESVANDWLVVRRNKKASNTETAFNGVINQVNQLEGVTLNQAIKFAAEKNWRGFEATWYLNEIKNTPQVAITYKTPVEVIGAIKSGQITHVNQIPSEFKSLIETQLRLGKVKPETAELLNKIGMVV